MDPGAAFGLLLAVVLMLSWLFPQPGGTIALFAILAAGLAVYTAVAWYRMRLWAVTAGGIAAVLGSVAALMIHALGYSFSTAPDAMAWLAYSLIALVPLSVLAASRFHRAEWEAWGKHMEGMRLRDILSLKHIPRLSKRDSKTS